MCLSNIEGPFIAEKDIVCYKHFRTLTIKGKERYESPYKGHLWPEKGMRSSLKVGSFIWIGKTVNNGLHAFRYKVDAEKDRKSENSSIVKKMIIPKGSKYYTGEFDYVGKCYAANKMMFSVAKTAKKKK